jgi:hypothetical protein
MARITRNIGLAIGTQAALGTVDPTIAALSGALTESNGIVLGDPSQGIGKSGISYSFERESSDKADVSGSFTKQASDFLSEKVASLSVSIPLKGRGTASPAADADYTPAAGIVALWRALGLTGAGWGSGNGWSYTPTASLQCSVKLWESGIAWVIRDVFASSCSIKLTPGEVAVATFELTGIVDSFGAASFPTFNYGAQSSLSAPAVKSVGHNWGISAALRGFVDGTLTISNVTEEFGDSNSSTGKLSLQTEREITFEGTIYADDGNASFERAELVRTTAPTELQTFTIGTAGGATANAIRVRLVTPELRSLTPAKVGTYLGWEAQLRAVASAANGEFELIYL